MQGLTPPVRRQRREYLLAELRCASLRARLAQADIEAIGLALKGELLTIEDALELLSDCDALRYIVPVAPASSTGTTP
jgi:hypothetical protein